MKTLRLYLVLLSAAAMIFGCASPQPSEAFAATNPVFKALLKRYPNLIPAVDQDMQGRPPKDSIIVLRQQDMLPNGSKMVGMIATKPNPPGEVINEMVEFSKAAGFDIIQFGRPITTVRFGFSAVTYSASVYTKPAEPAKGELSVPVAPSPSEATPIPHGQLPEGIYRVPSHPEYTGIGEKHWIRENIDRGSFILLEDGSLWQLSSLDRLDAGLWMKLSNIRVVQNEHGFRGFDYTIINTDDGEKATAKYLGKK